MKYRIEVTAQAICDMRGIYEYIAFDLQAPEHATKQLERLEKQISNLESMPKRFQLHKKALWASKGLHQMPVDNFIVFYLINQELVTIIRVMYSSRDSDKQLKNS